jgi:hypothetical protein
MNIDEQWKKLESGQDVDLSQMLNMQAIKSSASRDPLIILQKRILGNTVWAVLISIAYPVVLIFYPFWQLILCFVVVFLFHVWMIAENIILYKKLTRSFTGKSMLEEMESHYNNVQKWMRLQEKAFLFFYPVILIGACILGAALRSGTPLDEVIQRPKWIITSLIVVAIGTPLGYYLGKLLNHKAFGTYAEQLKNDIRALKEENRGSPEQKATN